MRASGFAGVPEPLGVDADGREWLRFIPGDVPIPPFPAWATTDDALTTGFFPAGRNRANNEIVALSGSGATFSIFNKSLASVDSSST